ncbi:related to DDR48-heat shock protein [uncultured Mediterranean phage uvMED]|nr:related to DDR48-heat shock protein [uncultured Mediterranean phage uvMED]
MSGGGGSSSDGGGGNDMQVSGMEAALSSEKGISTHADTRIGSTRGYEGSDAGFAANDNSYAGVTPSMSSINPNTGKFESGGFADSDDEYDTPDKAHYSQTQKDIATTNKELAKNNQIDTKMSKEEYDKFNKDLNEYYGTKNERYEPYGRAGKGTVNLTFKEHWDNVGMQSPTMSKSPTLRFLAASGRNISEYLTSDYGTSKYAGPGTDSGGLLGSFGGTGGTQVSTQDREIMRNIAPEAPYIVSGIAKPSNSPAANWYNNLGNTNTSGGFDLATEYAAAKNAVSQTLNNRGPMGMLAVSDSPYYDWLKTKSLDKGIL